MDARIKSNKLRINQLSEKAFQWYLGYLILEYLTLGMDAKKITPMVAQYKAIKEQYPDVILMFRLGDFYEMFGEDAVTASKELEIVLTSREAGKNPLQNRSG